MKTLPYLLVAAFLFVLTFSAITYFFFYGQIKNAETFIDYFYFGVVTTTTTGYGDMTPDTPAAKLWVSAYTLFITVFIFWVALNSIQEIEIPKVHHFFRKNGQSLRV